jgi:gp16 family phage-associated protein
MAKPAQDVPRTREEAAAWLDSHGISVAEFARMHGFSRMTVVDLLRGKRVGRRGEAHNAAIALGMKKGRRRDLRKAA